MSPTLTVLVGIPGAGKSHWLRNRLTRTFKPTVAVSTDAIREQVTPEYDHRYNEAIFSIAHVHTIRALEQGKDVIFDATNLRGPSRDDLTILARLHGATTKAVVFKTDFDLAVERVAARQGDMNAGISMETMERFKLSLEQTLIEIAAEDWDEIVFEDGDGF